MIKFKHHGNFHKAEKFLREKKDYRGIIQRLAQEGVISLRHSTPKDTGLSADRWSFEVEENSRGIKVYWSNDNIVRGIPVVILLQYGHGTRGGTFVQGRDFINPAMKPIFDKISDTLWKEVTR